MKAGKEKHCEGDRAKLQALQASQNAQNEAAAKASASAMEAKTKALQQINEDAYKPVFKAIRDSFGVSISTGVMIVTLFVSVIFEISHLLLILFLGQKLKRLEYLQQALIQYEANYMQSTGKTFNAGDFAEFETGAIPRTETTEPRQDYKQPKPGFGFVPSTAKMGDSGAIPAINGSTGKVSPPPLFKYQQPQQEAEKQPFGFIPSKPVGKTREQIEQEKPVVMSHKPLEPFRSKAFPDPAQLQPEPAADDTGSTYRQAIRDGSAGWQDTPLDAPAEPRARGFSESSTNPVHGVSEKPETAPQQQPGESMEKLYPAWVAAVKAGECRPSIDSTRTWIQKRIAPTMTGSKTNDLKRIDQMRKGFFVRAIREGKMVQNQSYTNGGKKYIWIG